MKTFSTVVVAAMLGTLSSVQAQSYRAPPAIMPPYEVLTIIRSIGLDPASRPMLRGPVYVIRAFDQDDIPLRVMVNARSGRIVSVIEVPPVAGYAAAGYGEYPRPPGGIGLGGAYPAAPRYPRDAAAPPQAAKRTPVPRAKPQESSAKADTNATTMPAAAPIKRPTSYLPKDASQVPGRSIPAPVAARTANPGETAHNPSAGSAPTPVDKAKTATELVPVAPLD